MARTGRNFPVWLEEQGKSPRYIVKDVVCESWLGGVLRHYRRAA